jgi:hypothetical protein
MDLFSGLGWTLLILTGIRALEAVKRLNQTKEDLVKLMDDTVSSADKIKLFIGEKPIHYIFNFMAFFEIIYWPLLIGWMFSALMR